MAKDDDEKEKPVFPTEYAHLEEALKEAQEKVSQIDQAIENMAQKKGPTLSFRPPGYGAPNAAFDPDASRQDLNQQRDTVSRDVEERVANETKDADPKQAAQWVAIVRHKVGRAEDRNKTPQQLADIRADVKVNDRSFGYMESLYFSRFTYDKDGEKTGDVKKEKEETGKEHSYDEMSDRFMNQLKREPDKGKEDMAPIKDDHDLDKE